MGPHTHGVIGWSGVLYVEFDKYEHSPTEFQGPLHDVNNGQQLEYKPEVEEGDIIIFPSCLTHWVSPNQSKKRRTIMSFNCRFA